MNALLLVGLVASANAAVIVRTCIEAGDGIKTVYLDDPAGALGVLARNATPQPSWVMNSQSSAASQSSALMATGINALDNRVTVTDLRNLTASGEWAVRECSLPNGSPWQTTALCVAFVNDDLYVVYGGPFSAGTVARLDWESCEWKDVGPAPKRVKGSANGPGGVCVGVPSVNRLFWWANDDDSLVGFDVSTGQSVVKPATTKLGSFFSIVADDETKKVYYLSDQDNQVFVVDADTLDMKPFTTLGRGSQTWADPTVRSNGNPTLILQMWHTIARYSLDGRNSEVINENYDTTCNTYTSQYLPTVDLPSPRSRRVPVPDQALLAVPPS